MHFGSLVAALSSYLQAHTQSGHWTIRVDDIDPPREVSGAKQEILACLTAHGFPVENNVLYQHQRTECYEEALVKLAKAKLVYACACSRRFIQQTQPMQTSSKSSSANTIYPGHCRTLNLPLQDHALRFVVSDSVAFEDTIQGRFEQNLVNDVGDFIVKRRDGLYAYQLATVVDDELDRITEVVRGSDLLDNTPRQIALGDALDFHQPTYLHVPVVVNHDGHKLSKQTGADALQASEANKNLLRAWRFLGQPSVFASTAINNTSQGIREFWKIAERHWSVNHIPRTTSLTLDQVS